MIEASLRHSNDVLGQVPSLQMLLFGRDAE
jgi:hypothetical protein